ncbi:MAG: hypothetical protein M1816_000955 [Peltula sp. TS41687]|nr:MAG: hypothetical protein M1816_000955 [Peltula sp. TS41687]
MPSVFSKVFRGRKDKGLGNRQASSSSRSVSNTSSQPPEDGPPVKPGTTGFEAMNVDGASSSNHGSSSETQPSEQTLAPHADGQSLPVPPTQHRRASWKGLNIIKKRSEVSQPEFSTLENTNAVGVKVTKYPRLRSLGRRLSIASRRSSSAPEPEDQPETSTFVVGPVAPVLPPMDLPTAPFMGGEWPAWTGDTIPSGPSVQAQTAPEASPAKKDLAGSMLGMNSDAHSSKESFYTSSEGYTEEEKKAMADGPEVTKPANSHSESSVGPEGTNGSDMVNANLAHPKSSVGPEVTNADQAHPVPTPMSTDSPVETTTSEEHVEPLAGKDNTGIFFSFSGNAEAPPLIVVGGMSGPAARPRDGLSKPGEGIQPVPTKASASRSSSFGSRALKLTLRKVSNTIADIKSSISAHRRRSSSQSYYEADAEDNASIKPMKSPVSQTENTEGQVSGLRAPTTTGSNRKSSLTKFNPFKGKAKAQPLPCKVDSEIWGVSTGNGHPTPDDVFGPARDGASDGQKKLDLSEVSRILRSLNLEEKPTSGPSRAGTRKSVRWSDEMDASPAPELPPHSLGEVEPGYGGVANETGLNATSGSSVSHSVPIEQTPLPVDSVLRTYEEEPYRPFVAARLPVF